MDKPVDVVKLAVRLKERYRELQAAHLTIGYLERKVKDRNEYDAHLAAVENQIRKISRLEQENQEMMQVVRQAKMAEVLARQNEEVREYLKTAFEESPVLSKAVSNTRKRNERISSDRPYKMEDYYNMLQDQLQC